MAHWTLAGDLGGTKMAAALVDSAGQIVFEETRPTQAERGIESVSDRFVDLLREVMAWGGETKPVACGVAAPGLIDSVAGEIRYAANLSGARNYPLRRRLEAGLDLPIAIDNDLRLHALGESTFGSARGSRDFFFAAVGTGVGGALFIDGRLYRGAHHGAGEIGHILIDSSPTAPVCGCGRRGCVESLASGPAIADRFHRRAAEHGLTLPSPAPGLKDIAPWAGRSDLAGELAREAIDHGARALGRGLSVATNLLDPERIIVGGGVSELGATWLNIVKQAMVERVLITDTVVELARLGGKAALIGSAVLARERLAAIR